MFPVKIKIMRILFAIVFTAFTNFAFAQKPYIYCGRLIDTRAGKTQLEMTIIIEKNKIIDLIKGYAPAGDDDKKIDLNSYTVMPGLMDCHVHLEEVVICFQIKM